MTAMLWRELGAVILAVSIICGLFSVRLVPSGTRRLQISWLAFGKNLLVSLPLSIIGWSAGYLTGLSREPVAAAAIPAILTLAGALFGYISLKKLSDAPFVALGVSLFAITVVMSTAQYSAARETERFRHLLLLSEQERVVRLRRANMDLPENIPGWITGDQQSEK